MRRAIAVVAAVVVAALGAGIVGEYEFRGIAVPAGAGVGLGYAVAASITGIGRWRGLVAGILAASVAAAGVLGAGWIDSDEGVEPYPAPAAAAAVIGAATAGGIAGRRRPSPPPASGSTDPADGPR